MLKDLLTKGGISDRKPLEEETEEAFGEAARKSYKDLTIEDVPFFNRPMSSGPNDRRVGEDDLGRTVYQTPTGHRYTLGFDPDQRSGREKIIDTAKGMGTAVKDYVKDPRLPSVEQIGNFASEVAKQTYQQIHDTVRGNGTYGDVFGLAGGVGLVSNVVGKAPKGAVTIFGGQRATSPGLDAQDIELPQSLGRDGKPRFEIDDSKMELKEESLIPDRYFKLNDVIYHQELFRQYPGLKNFRVNFSSQLDPLYRGSYSPDKNLLTVHANLLDQPDEVKATLLHEIQHWVQEKEGFDPGTNPFTKDVDVVANKAFEEEKLKAIQYEKEIYPKLLDEYNSFNYREVGNKMLDYLAESAQRSGLSFEEFLSKSYKDADSQFFTPLYYREKIMESLNLWDDFRLGLTEKPKGFITPADKVRTSMVIGLKNLAKDAKKKGLEDYFTESFGFSPEEVIDLSDRDLRDFLIENGVLPEEPKKPKKFFSDKVTIDDKIYWYRAKSGEVEAKNAADRRDLSLEERFDRSPQSTERISRDQQWISEDLSNPTSSVSASFKQTNTPLFHNEGVGVTKLPDGRIKTSFYDPYFEAVTQLPIGPKGMKGSAILALLSKTKGYKGQRFSSLGLEIDPQVRYTKKELEDLFLESSNVYEIETTFFGKKDIDPSVFEQDIWENADELTPEEFNELVHSRSSYGEYGTVQRFDNLGEEINYGEATMLSKPDLKGRGIALGGHPHFPNNAIAHTRFSVRDLDGEQFLLVEELQSDAFNYGVKTGTDRKINPFKSHQDYIRPLILHLANQAKEAGVDEIFIPSSNPMVNLRGGLSKEMAETVYDKAVPKALKELSEEMDFTFSEGYKSTWEESLSRDFLEDPYVQNVIDKVVKEEDALMDYEDFLDYLKTFSQESVTEILVSSARYHMRNGEANMEKVLKKYNFIDQVKVPGITIKLGDIPQGMPRFAEGGLVH